MTLKGPRRHRRQLRSGITFIEVMIAGLLMSVGIMGLVSMWAFSFNMTVRTDDKGVAYCLGRRALEQVKFNTFKTAAEGTYTYYYDGNQAAVSSTAARYRVTVSVVSDQVKSGTAGVAGAQPADAALRTVTVTVQLHTSGEVLYQTATYLVRAGT